MFFKRLIDIIKYSFFSKEFYIDLYQNIKGLKLQYFLALLFITNLGFVIPSYFISKNTVKNNELLKEVNLNYIAKKLPESIAIQNSILDIPDNIPEVVFLENQQPSIGFVKHNNLADLKLKNIPIIISNNGTYILTDHKYIFISFAMHLPKDGFLSPKDIIQQINIAQENLGIIFIAFYLISTILKALLIGFNLLFFAIFGFLYMKILKNNTNFLSIYRIALFASFPSIIIECILNIYLYTIHNNSVLEFFNIVNTPLKTNIIFLITIGYFYYALFYITKTPALNKEIT